jgi:GAF domain-containing protein/HAMP domain-containing protein
MGITPLSTPDPKYQPSATHPANNERSGLTFQINLLTIVLLTALVAVLVFFAITQPAWQWTTLTAIQAGAGLIACAAVGKWIKQTSWRVYLLIFAILVSTAGLSLMAENQAIPAAFIGLAYTILLTSVSVGGSAAETGLTIGMVGAWLVSLAGLLVPVEKVTLPGADIAFATIISIFLMIYLTLLAMEYITASLRLRLILGSLVLVIIPLIAVSFYQSYTSQNTITQRLQETLNSAANQTATRVDQFLANNRDMIVLDSSLKILSRYLTLPENKRAGSPEEKELSLTFSVLESRSQQFMSAYGLVDNNGKVLIDINPSAVGKYEASLEYFAEGVQGKSVISNVEFSTEDNHPYIYFSAPIFFPDTRYPAGFLRVTYDAQILQYLLQDNTNLLGSDTFPILIDENQLRLGDTYTVSNLYQTLAPTSATRAMYLQSIYRMPKVDQSRLFTNLQELSDQIKNSPDVTFFTTNLNPENKYNTSKNFIATVKLKNKPWTMLYTQGSASIDELNATQQKSISIIAVFLAGVIALIGTVIARALTQPIIRLTATAQKITEGNLSVSAPITNDEIGTLANAFNIMTARLRQFINDLEERVKQRTSELAERNETLTYRNRQIQTISEVARTITNSRDLETLLTEVAVLVSGRFGFYHVGIFLLDDIREYAVLRAANSAGGKRMLSREHKLAVGQTGIVGHVAGSGRPRIATDVGQEAIFFNNPDLPLTRSEMALPLTANEEVIGVLDVQSTQSNAFSEEDLELFSTLADQVAAAIINSRAFEDTQRALEEARLVHQEYLHQEWSRELAERTHFTYEYTHRGVVARDRVFNAEVDQIFASGDPLVRGSINEKDHSEPAVLGVPIKLRGETIGIIRIQDEGADNRQWVGEEVDTVQAIADLVGQALENARLFEQTVRRAERERRVLEITSKIRSATDPQTMMKIAVSELQQALHASKTQIILNQAGNSAYENDHPSAGNDSGFGSNGNGKSGLA